jgi:hypothetical protein
MQMDRRNRRVPHDRSVRPESIGTAPDPVCREVIVIKGDMPMQSCILSQPALAEWKDRSILVSLEKSA